ncbi:YcaO-like family protein [Granulosicoccus antarcticus]|uniref:YcaO-like family protein n=1 Tax=Granulosicoccus antarcticus TaxID=437505 RepID=UPI00197AC776|nr:YcaO-like family protein [Granulosicoccus antarcticus]
MQDSCHPITYRVGTHRICDPEETLTLVRPYMPAMGITRIADVTGLDTIGIPVVMVCRPNSRSVSVSQGKGSTLAAASASGLMESVEGFHAEHITLPLRIASVVDMQNSGCRVSIEGLPTVENSPFHRHFPIAWIEAVDLLRQQSSWVPYEMVHTNYTWPRPSGSGCFPASSNGLASGNCLAEATIHAICEVIERDAITLWHQLGAQAIDRTSINPDTIDDPLCLETLGKLEEAGQDTYLWDITSDSGIPSYFAVIMDRQSHTRHIGVGSGTHLSRHVALLRALHEAVQVRTTYIVGARDDLTPREYTSEGIDEKQRFFSNIIRRSSFLTDYSDRTDIHSASVEEDLDTLLQCLQRIAISQMLLVDLSKPEYDIAVVRVIIPGLESPHDDDGYIPGARALGVRNEADNGFQQQRESLGE